MLEAVIFDFDGVIVNSPEYYFRHMKKALHRRHSGISDAEIGNLVAKNFEEELAGINSSYGLNVLLKDFIEETSSQAFREILAVSSPDPFMKKLVLELHDSGKSLAIASNTSRKNILPVLEKFGFNDCFSVIVSSEEVKKFKPFPDVYSKALELLDARAENCLAVEDTIVGALSAKKAGLKVVAVPNAFSKNLDFGHCDLVAESFKDLTLGKLLGLVE